MRSFIKIIEDAQATPQAQPELEGTIDVPGLSAMLSKVTDPTALQTAFTDMQAGSPLAPPQKAQLALAFISLLDADQGTRQKIITKMQGLSFQAPVSAPSQAQPVQEQALTELEVGGDVDPDYIDDVEEHDFEHPQIDMFPELPPVDINVPNGFKKVGRMRTFFVVERLYKQDEYSRQYGEQHTYYLLDRGKPVAMVALKTPEKKWLLTAISDHGAKGFQVGAVHVAEDYRGARLTLDIYAWLLTNVCDFLMADELQTDGGVRLWQMLLNSSRFDTMVYDYRTGMSRKRWRGKDFDAVYKTDGNLFPWVTLRGKSYDIMCGPE